MKHTSAYLDWYIHVPELKHDLRSSGIVGFKYDLALGNMDLSVNYAHGNPQTAKVLAQRYHTKAENVFISGEGATGQNARILRYLAERNPKKKEAIVEYPTYEPLFRQVQEYFPIVRRLERKPRGSYVLDADALRKIASEKTSVLVITNPHAPSGAVSSLSHLKEVTEVARERGFNVICDEIYAEFDRSKVPTIFSADPELGIVTTSFTKAYGLGGLKLGTALAEKTLVDELYTDVLNTVGNSPNVVQEAAINLLTKGKAHLESHRRKWLRVKKEAEEWMTEKSLKYFPNEVSITYWTKLPISDTYKWVCEKAIPHHQLAIVPGAFFYFTNTYERKRSNMVRIGLGAVNPDEASLSESLEVLEKSLKT